MAFPDYHCVTINMLNDAFHDLLAPKLGSGTISVKGGEVTALSV